METLFVALRVLLSLGAVLALLWLLQRRFARSGSAVGKAKSAKSLTVVARQNVGSKASVVVLEHDGRSFLLGVTEHGVSVLHSNEIEAQSAVHGEVIPDAEASAEFDAALHSDETLTPSHDRFARVLAEAGHMEPEAQPGTASRRAAVQAATAPRESKLTGSILAPETWKQAAAFVRNGR